MHCVSRVVVKRYDGKENVPKIMYGLTSTPFGDTLIAGISNKTDTICHLYFAQENTQTGLERLKRCWPNAVLCEDNKVANKWKQLIFDSRKETICVLVKGTDFQVDVWKALLEIPFGETRTYGQVAEMVGKPRAIRAAASAVGSNEVSFIIPCHRVIAKNGNKLKYGWGADIKQKILQYEGIKL